MDAVKYTENLTVDGTPDDKEDQDPVEQMDVVAKVIIAVAYVIILLLSFVGNSLVIHLVRTRRNLRKNPFNWLLVNTAMADLVDVISASSLSLPLYLCGTCWLSGILGTIVCKLIPFLLVVSICASIWTLTVIATDRYLAIVCMQRGPLSQRSVVRSIIAVWLFAGLVFCGQLYKYKTEESEDGAPLCYHEWYDEDEISILFYKVEMIVRVVITYAAPLVVMAVLYSLIAFYLWTHKPPGHLSSKQGAYVRQAKKRRAVIKMMMTAVMVFAICWLPALVSHIMGQFYSDAYEAIPQIVQWLFYWFAHVNTAIHPWLFIVFSENLRVEIKRIFGNFWNIRHPALSMTSQQTSGLPTVVLTASRHLAASRSSLDTSFLSLDTRF